jgi:hypothetical protein
MRTMLTSHDRPAVADRHRSGAGHGVRRSRSHVLASHVRCAGGMSGRVLPRHGRGAVGAEPVGGERLNRRAGELAPLYCETVARFQATGVLREPQTVDLFEVGGGTVNALGLAAEYGRQGDGA